MMSGRHMELGREGAYSKRVWRHPSVWERRGSGPSTHANTGK